MRVHVLCSFLVGFSIAACGSEPASVGSSAPGPSGHPGGGTGGAGNASFPLPSYWGAASQYAVPATITVTGQRSVTLHGGAFAVADTTPGQPWAMFAPAVWVGYGDPISGIADGAFAYDAYAVFRPNDGLLIPRTLAAGDVDPISHAAFGYAGTRLGADAGAMSGLKVALSAVSLEGTSSPNARRAGTYYAVHGTMDFSVPPATGEAGPGVTIHVEF